MPTLVEKDIAGGNNDYATLALFEAYCQATTLTGADEIRRGRLYAYTETTAFVIDGSTTDATRYIDIVTVSTGVAVMPYSATAFRLEVSGSTCIMVSDDHVRLRGWQVQLTATGSTRYAIQCTTQAAGAEVFIERMLIRGVLSGASLHTAIQSTASGSDRTLVVRNNVIYNFVSGSLVCKGIENTSSSAAVYVYGNTLYNCRVGIQGLAGTRARNNLTAGCNDGFATTSNFHADSNYNASDIAADAPGANSQNGVAFTFVNAGGGDFHLASGDAGAKDLGQDLSGVTHGFTVDFDDVTRSGTWDIGADEYVSSDTTLTVADAGVGLGAESPALEQANTLAVADAAIALGAESPALTQANVLGVADAVIALEAEGPTLSQANVLAVADATIGLGVEDPELTQANVLGVADALITLEAEAPALSQASMLAVADALVTLEAESPGLTQASVLTLADVSVALGIEAPALVQAGALAVADATIALEAETVALIQANVLAVADALVALAMESPAPSSSILLEVADALAALSLESPELSVAFVLSPNRGTIALVSESPALIQAGILLVNDALIALSIDAPFAHPDYPAIPKGKTWLVVLDFAARLAVRDYSTRLDVEEWATTLAVDD